MSNIVFDDESGYSDAWRKRAIGRRIPAKPKERSWWTSNHLTRGFELCLRSYSG
jgi:hypothetical protein